MVTTPAAVLPVFAVVWAAFAIGGFLFFARNRDAARKRRYFPRLAIGAGVVFALVIAFIVPWPALFLFIPFIGVIVWLNIRMTRFCDACGRTLINQAWWSKMLFCPYCGEKLKG
jgi:hypothetical protein